MAEESGEIFKLQILEGIKNRGEEISIYKIGSWWDLCAGPHVESTGQLDSSAIELYNIAGAYWRGDENNPMLLRIQGHAFENPKQLEYFNWLQEEAKKRDHRLLGKKLDLFSIQEHAGGGLVFWHPKGSIVRKIIEDFWKETHIDNGYELLHTPHIANINLWNTSGHTDFYKDDMFGPISVKEDKPHHSHHARFENKEDQEGNTTPILDNQILSHKNHHYEDYQLKPMNCPLHCLLYKSNPKTFRQLPVRYAELGTVYRYERSGALHGLFRVRGFTQDDAHIFCLPSQLEDEIVGVLDLMENILKKFGFHDYEVMLSTRPAESVGTDEIWDKATLALKNALQRKNYSYNIDDGGGAFYGPKIDVKIRDALGRQWQCSTVQCDFNLPERFGLEYTASGGEKEQPIMVHRAIFGSLERFFGVLIESTGGDLPLWIAPVQLRLLPVVDSALDFCQEVKKIAREKYNLRVEIDRSGNRMNKMVRNGELEKVPILAIIGDKEKDSKTLSFRVKGKGDIGNVGSVEDALQLISNAVLSGKDI